MAKPRFLRRHYPHQVQGVRSTFVVDHLSQAAPPHLFLVQNKTRKKDVKGGSAAPSDDAKILAAFGCVNLTSSKGLLDPPPEFNVAQRRGYSGSIIISLLPPVLCWCERSGAIRHSSFARSTRRCRSLRRLCLPRWLPPSPGRSRVPCLHRS
jgi:hypothetical protein